MNHLYLCLYGGYVTVWLLNEYKYVCKIDYSTIIGTGNYALINELIIGNFLFGSIGIVLSLAIGSSLKTNVYFFCTCAIGLIVGAVILYLDSSTTGNAGQAHMETTLAFFTWLIPLVILSWSGIIKDLGSAIFKRNKKKRDDR